MRIRASRRPIRPLAATLLLVTLAACGGSAASQSAGSAPPLIKVTASYLGDFESSFGVAVALKEGYFRAAGLDVQPEQVANGPVGIAAMQSGHLDFAFMGPGPIQLAMKGNAVVIGSSALTVTDYILARSSIASIGQLKGKQVLYSAGTVDELLLVLALNKVGLKLSDVKSVNIPDFATVATAFLSGSGDAIALSTPFSTAVTKKDPSARILLSDGTLYPAYALPDSWTATRTMLNSDPGTVSRFMWAIMKANDWVIQHPAAAIKIVAAFTKEPVSVMETNAPPNNIKLLPSSTWLQNYANGTAQKWYAAVGKTYVQGGVLTAVPPADSYLDFAPAIAAGKQLNDSSYQSP